MLISSYSILFTEFIRVQKGAFKFILAPFLIECNLIKQALI